MAKKAKKMDDRMPEPKGKKRLPTIIIAVTPKTPAKKAKKK